MAHLTNFSFEFSYKIFTEDASVPLLYYGAKKSKMTKKSNQGGPASCGGERVRACASARVCLCLCLCVHMCTRERENERQANRQIDTF